jgi:hypothetical protein
MYNFVVANKLFAAILVFTMIVVAMFLHGMFNFLHHAEQPPMDYQPMYYNNQYVYPSNRFPTKPMKAKEADAWLLSKQKFSDRSFTGSATEYMAGEATISLADF